MTLEEYIIKRKREDGINEYDLDKRLENTRICVNYVFEYFNNYLETKPADEKTVLHEQKIEKYYIVNLLYVTSVLKQSKKEGHPISPHRKVVSDLAELLYSAYLMLTSVLQNDIIS